MDDIDIVKEIRAEVHHCRENRNLMLAQSERNIISAITESRANVMDIKNTLIERLNLQEKHNADELRAVRASNEAKISSAIFRWAIGLLAAGLIGGGFLNYATLQSVKTDSIAFRLYLDEHIKSSIETNDAQTKIINELTYKYNPDANIFIPTIRSPVNGGSNK